MRSMFRLSAFLFAAVALAISACSFAREGMAHAFLSVKRWFKEVAIARLVLAAPMKPDASRSVELVQARMYLQRLVKRDGLRYAEAWRMCPLT